MLASIFILMGYDLFNEVSKRGEVTEARNLPRVYRILILFISVWFYYVTVKVKKSRFNNILSAIYLTITLYILFDPNFGLASLISLSKLLYLFFAYLFFFKFYGVFSNDNTLKYLNIFVAFSVIVLSLHIIGSRLNLLGGGTTIKTYGNNNAYLLLSFLPMVYLNTSLKLKRVLTFVLVIGIFLSLKRGAMVALLFCLLGGFLLEKRFINKQNFIEKFKRIFIVVGAFIFLFFVYSKFADIFIERFADFSGDSKSFGSGRGNVYSLIWNDWFDSDNIIAYLLGKGYNSVQVLTKLKTGRALMAHSDVFNFIHSYGVLGIGLLITFFIHQLRIIKKLYALRVKLVVPYFMLFVIFFFKSIYSGNFETPNFIYLLIGFAVINASLGNLKIKF
mgnify:CR=1 FL=1